MLGHVCYFLSILNKINIELKYTRIRNIVVIQPVRAMEAVTLSDKKSQIFETKNRAETIMSEEEKVNSFLDKIIDATRGLNELNDIFIELLDHVVEVSSFNNLDKQGSKDLEEILDSLYSINTKASKLFSEANKVELLRNGCKSALLDFRINIRNLREALGDLEELFFLEEDDVELDNLLEQFAV